MGQRPRSGCFHENLGVLMVIPAFLLILSELVLISALIIEPTAEGPLVFADGVGMPRRRSNRRWKAWPGPAAASASCPAPRSSVLPFDRATAKAAQWCAEAALKISFFSQLFHLSDREYV